MIMELPPGLPPTPKPPQFSLRTLFALVSALGVLLAVFEAIGLLASLGLLLFLILVGLHVIGNALGTTLRDQSPSPAQVRDGLLAPIGPLEYRMQLDRPRTTSRLSEQLHLGWVVAAATLLGAVAGGYTGTWVLVQIGDQSTRGLILGAISSGVLGAFFGGLSGCFLKTWLSAWWQASSESDPRAKPKISGGLSLP
jgi:hypothetical protein